MVCTCVQVRVRCGSGGLHVCAGESEVWLRWSARVCR